MGLERRGDCRVECRICCEDNIGISTLIMRSQEILGGGGGGGGRFGSGIGGDGCFCKRIIFGDIQL